MPRTCTICGHKKRSDIDKALIERQPFRNIAAQFKVSTSALVRHSDDHLPSKLLKAQAAREAADADALLAQVVDLRDRPLLSTRRTASRLNSVVNLIPRPIEHLPFQ